jgi:phosphatidylglycerol:prolipoprotein diacylglycerol transferase
MYPDLFQIGGLRIASFGVLMAMACLFGGVVLAGELRRKGADPGAGWNLVGWAVLGGIGGAKFYYLVLNWPETAVDPTGAAFSRSGLVWYGGFCGAAILILWRLRRDRRPVLLYADALAPALALAYGVGRLGCFMAGDDYGLPTDLPWGVAFPRGLPPSTAHNLRTQFGVAVDPKVPDGALLAVHPTQLYEVALMLVIFTVLWRLRKRWPQAGRLFFLYLVLAGVERLIIEVLRAKDDRFLGPFTVAQAISLGSVAAGIVGSAWALRRAGGTCGPLAAPGSVQDKDGTPSDQPQHQSPPSP